MNPPVLHDWSTFFSAEVGAAATLSGLLVVAVSINLARIVDHPILPGRAIETLLFLVGALVVASLGLVPAQSFAAFGAEALIVGLVQSGLSLLSALRGLPAIERQHRWERAYQRILLCQSAGLPTIAGGAFLLAGVPAGIYGVMAGILLSLVVGVLNSWVLLIEILR